MIPVLFLQFYPFSRHLSLLISVQSTALLWDNFRRLLRNSSFCEAHTFDHFSVQLTLRKSEGFRLKLSHTFTFLISFQCLYTVLGVAVWRSEMAITVAGGLHGTASLPCVNSYYYYFGVRGYMHSEWRRAPPPAEPPQQVSLWSYLFSSNWPLQDKTNLGCELATPIG